jgi:hypothetical protein
VRQLRRGTQRAIPAASRGPKTRLECGNSPRPRALPGASVRASPQVKLSTVYGKLENGQPRRSPHAAQPHSVIWSRSYIRSANGWDESSASKPDLSARRADAGNRRANPAAPGTAGRGCPGSPGLEGGCTRPGSSGRTRPCAPGPISGGPEPCPALPGAPLGIAQAVHVAHVGRHGEQQRPPGLQDPLVDHAAVRKPQVTQPTRGRLPERPRPGPGSQAGDPPAGAAGPGMAQPGLRLAPGLTPL